MSQTPLIISRLIDGIAEGDTKAFSKFYDLLYPKVYQFSRYFFNSEVQCKEIVADLFYTLWQRRKVLVEIENLENYIYISVKNLALKYKNYSIHHLNTELDSISGNFYIETQTPEKILQNSELKEAIENAINNLPERCKLIFIMAKERGLKQKEIAEILSISEHTVHAQMTIASKKIAKALEKYLA